LYRNDLKFRENGGEKYFYIDGKVYYVDLYDPLTGKVIEFYGSYWHADPKSYTPKDVVNYPSDIKLLA